MEDILENMAVTTILVLINKINGDTNKKSRWKRALLKIFKGIANNYKDDSEFKSVLK